MKRNEAAIDTLYYAYCEGSTAHATRFEDNAERALSSAIEAQDAGKLTLEHIETLHDATREAAFKAGFKTAIALMSA